VNHIHQLEPRDDPWILSRFFYSQIYSQILTLTFILDLVQSSVKFAPPLMLLALGTVLSGCPIISYGGTCYIDSPSLQVSKTSIQAGQPLTLVALESATIKTPTCGTLRRAVFRNGSTVIGEDTQAPFVLDWKPQPDKDGIQPGFGTFDLSLSATFVYENPPDVIEPRENFSYSSTVTVSYTNSEVPK
jgi:hypothetical protein